MTWSHRGDDVIIGEAKGVTTSSGLDVDSMYGQLLRRMAGKEGTRYAVIVPEKLVPAASRVPEEIRRRLRTTCTEEISTMWCTATEVARAVRMWLPQKVEQLTEGRRP